MGHIKKAVLNGQTVYVEMGEPSVGGGPAVMSGRPGQQALDLSASLKEVIVGYFGALAQSFEALETNRQPTSVIVEFGLKLSGDAKFYIANGPETAGVKITAEWIPARTASGAVR